MQIERINQLLLLPLSDIVLGGGNTVAEAGAVHTIYFLVRGAYEQGNSELFKYMYVFYLEIFTQINLYNEDFINCMAYLIQNGGIKPVVEYVSQLIDR